jgi:hypothetical protein
LNEVRADESGAARYQEATHDEVRSEKLEVRSGSSEV